MILNWLLNALSLVIVAWIVPGIEVRGFGAALLAALVFGLVNATLGLLLKIISFPFVILTFGLLLFIINALMLELAASLVSGFSVRGFGPAFVGAILLSLISMVLRRLIVTAEATR